MINEKEKTIETTDILDNAKLRDEIYAEFLKSKLRESEDDKKNGRYATLEEFKKEMEKIYKRDYINYQDY